MNEAPSCRPFIPAWLDDLRLTSNQFRIFCHLSRRAGKDGSCHPAAPSIMSICQMSDNTLWRVLRDLETAGLIVRAKHFRNSNKYQIATSPPERVTAKEGVTQDKGEVESPQSAGCQSPQSAGCQSPQKRGCKGYPLEGNPIEGNPSGDLFPSVPKKSKSQNPKTDSLAESIWKLTPKMGRERSSMKQLQDALKKIPSSEKPTPETLLPALEAWNKSETWTKDGGQYVGGIHIWVKNQKWKNPPAPSAPMPQGQPQAAAINIPNRPSTPETIQR